MLTESIQNEIKNYILKYPERKSALIPTLHLVQKEKGYLSDESMKDIADILQLAPSEVIATATFYTMLKRKPRGKYHIQVCTNLSCSLLGAEHIMEYICKKLGIKEGETTPDNLFSLEEVQCLGSCGTAPVMQINDDYYENLTESKVDEIIEELRIKN